MTRRQFRVLYREFLFRIVDRDLLASHATGDSSQFLLQLVTLLGFLGICLTVPAILLDFSGPPQARLFSLWSIQHFLIATTMLVVGVVAVLSWDSLFPNHRDVFVLGPLPVRAHTILIAKLAGVATALALTVLTLQIVAGTIWPLAFNTSAPAQTALAFTYDAALPPIHADGLRSVLDRDLSAVQREGMLAAGAGGGVAIGIYQQGARHLFTYGAATPASIFQIGSITKPFTGLVLAHMVKTGAVGLEQPVRELIPTVRLPVPAGREITLLDLATHHSGLPGMPSDFRAASPLDPFAHFGVGALTSFLMRRGVERPDDARFTYSNLGFGLLGHALSSRAATDYATLVRTVVTGPLQMDDTAAVLTTAQKDRLIQGYSEDRRAVPPWNMGALAGAGALYSTAPDLMTWLEANLHPERVADETLAAALTASQQRRVDVGSAGGVALAWMLNNATGDVSHEGTTSNFTTDVFFNHEEDLAVAVLSNIGPGAATSAAVIGEHVRARLRGHPAVSLAEVSMPATGGVRSWLTLTAAYWLTMCAAGLFVFGLALAAQGLTAALLPRRHFVRVSSLLQLAALTTLITVYFVQPMAVRPVTVLSAQSSIWSASPSYWFLGLFQALSGSNALAPLAQRAWTGLGVVLTLSALAYTLSYVRTLRRIAEQPDIALAGAQRQWLPALRTRPMTAIVQFSLRTLFRSAPHRVVLAFYWGMAFALTAVVMKLPRARELAAAPLGAEWQDGAIPLLAANMLMMAFAVLAARAAFALPRDLAGNWIFRMLPIRRQSENLPARRRALLMASAAPVWLGWAAFFLSTWPWQIAAAHLIALAMSGGALVEAAVLSTPRIPFTRSYLPGKSRVHIAAFVALVLVLPLILFAATFERDALDNPFRYAQMSGALIAAWGTLRARTAWLARVDEDLPDFEDVPADTPVTLGVWDSRA